MRDRTGYAAVAVAVLLAGCQMGDTGFGGSGGSSGSGGFGGSGGSTGSAGLSLARDVCATELRERGQAGVRVVSAQEVYGATAARVTLEARRDPMTVSTTLWTCDFFYATGASTISRA